LTTIADPAMSPISLVEQWSIARLADAYARLSRRSERERS
jgi:hypothetical protein